MHMFGLYGARIQQQDNVLDTDNTIPLIYEEACVRYQGAVHAEGRVKDPQSYETMALSCSHVSRSLALMGHAVDIGDAAIILNQRITEKLSSNAWQGGVQAALHWSPLIWPSRCARPLLAFTVEAMSSSIHVNYKLHIPSGKSVRIKSSISDAKHYQCSLRRHAMQTVKFSVKGRGAAAAVLQQLQKGGGSFNGLHLRLESDYESLLLKQGPKGFDTKATMYLRGLKQHGCDGKTPLYTGGGICFEEQGEGGSEINRKVRRWLLDRAWKGVSSAIMHKAHALSEGLLTSLTSEQLAAVGALVLVESKPFIGHSVSSMSWLVQELRVLAGRPRETSFMLASWPNNTRLYQQTYSLVDE